MEKQNGYVNLGATTFLAPVPAVLVGCADGDGWTRGEGAPNLLTIAWTGICCTKPPMLGIAVRPERYSYEIIARTGEFTVNLVSRYLCRAMDFCGVKSGRELDKFKALNLHAVTAPPLACAPALEEAPAYLCCKVKQTLPLGSHTLFLAEIVEVRVREEFVQADGAVDERAMELVAFAHGKYAALGDETGFFGYSVASNEVLKRRMPRKAVAASHGKNKPTKRSGKV